MQRVRPVVLNTEGAKRPPAEKTTFRLQCVRQPVPFANGARASQGGVCALERFVILTLRLRLRRLPRGQASTTIIPPHYCRGQNSRTRHLRLVLSSGFFKTQDFSKILTNIDVFLITF